MAAKHQIGLPDVLTCVAKSGCKVAASGTVRSLLPTTKLSAGETEQPERIVVNRGIGSMDSTLFQFIVSGWGEVTLKYEAQKGGTLNRTVKLKEQFEPKPIEHKRAIPVPAT
jgi:hypothetical protein